MKNYKGRLKRAEAMVGVSEDVEYAVIINGYRTFEDCIKTGRPYYRCPDGSFGWVMGVCEIKGETCHNRLGSSKEDTDAILKRLGYEEIKTKEDMKSPFENMSTQQLTNYLLGRGNNA